MLWLRVSRGDQHCASEGRMHCLGRSAHLHLRQRIVRSRRKSADQHPDQWRLLAGKKSRYLHSRRASRECMLGSPQTWSKRPSTKTVPTLCSRGDVYFVLLQLHTKDSSEWHERGVGQPSRIHLIVKCYMEAAMQPGLSKGLFAC